MSQDPSRPLLHDPLVDQPSSPPRALPPPVPGTPAQTPRPAATTTVQPRAPKAKRRRPARGARAGALMMSCAATGGLTYWFAGENSSQAAADALAALPAPVATSPATTTPRAATTPSTSATATPEATDEAAGAASTSTAPAAAAAPTPAAQSGTTTQAFDGSVVQTRFGPMQVQVQITDGAISEVAVLQYPANESRSVAINSRALPTLRTEALTAQSADVDTVSGATYTSDAYATSLQSAIDAARAAGATQIT